MVGHRIYTYIASSLVISMFFGMRPCLSIPNLLDACSYGTHVIVMYTKPLMQTRASEPDLKLRRVHTCMHVRMGTCKHTYLHKLHACMHSTYNTRVHTYVHTYIRTYMHCLHVCGCCYIASASAQPALTAVAGTYICTYVHMYVSKEVCLCLYVIPLCLRQYLYKTYACMLAGRGG